MNDSRHIIDCVASEEPRVVEHDEVDDLLPHSHDRVLNQSVVNVLGHASSLLLLTLDVVWLHQLQPLCCSVLLDEQSLLELGEWVEVDLLRL